MNLSGFFPKFYNLTPPPHSAPPKFIRNIKISAFGLIISKWQWVFIVRLLALSTQFTISVKLYVKHCGVHGKKLIVKLNSIQNRFIHLVNTKTDHILSISDSQAFVIFLRKDFQYKRGILWFWKKIRENSPQWIYL